MKNVLPGLLRSSHNKKIVLALGLLLMIQTLSAQKKIIGKVVESQTKEPIEGATIIEMHTNKIVSTRKNGEFNINETQKDTLMVSAFGYISRKIIPEEGKKLMIELKKGEVNLKEITITDRIASINTFKFLSSLDLNKQPAKSAQDLLRLVPGLFIAQHQGGGKAEQIFLRGFDADHGTDVNLSVDGIPVNMVSHAHGQGYADLHFLIPETVSGYEFGKGPYYSSHGDFTTAGYVAYFTKSQIDEDLIKVEAGQFNTLRVLAMVNLLGDSSRKKGQSAYIAGEGLYSNGGPFALPEHFTRYNLFGKFNTQLGPKNKLTAEISTLKSDWRSAGEIPDRAVSEGYIANRFGVLDSAQGGHTDRTNLSLKLGSELKNNGFLENQVYYSHYHFNLITNFTYFYYFPNKGDEFRQIDSRDLLGYNGKWIQTQENSLGTITNTLGMGFRYDHIYNSQLDHTENGKFLEYLQFGQVQELNLHGYFDKSLSRKNWTFSFGLRGDYFRFHYLNLAPDSDIYSTPLFQGINPSAQKFILSPKLFIAYTPHKNLEYYFKAGKGFHSNDARVVIANQGFQTLPSAYGADLGLNWKPAPGLFINTALWYLFLDQEFTFGQDLTAQPGGPVSPSGRTQREGIDFSTRYQISPWLFSFFNINMARPRYLDSAKGNNYIPLAPTLTSTGGLDFKFKNGINGGINYRYLKNRSANNDYSLTARGYFITDLTANYTRRKFEIGISIENLLNRTWDESQFEYTSQLKGETKPVDQVSYTPGVPFFAKVHLSFFFK